MNNTRFEIARPVDVTDVSSVWANVRAAGDVGRASADTSAEAIVSFTVSVGGSTNLVQSYFDLANEDYNRAKNDKANSAKRAIAEDWNRFSKRLWYHFDKASLRIGFPNINGAGGDVTLVAKDQALAKAKADRIEKAESDRLAVAARQARLAENEQRALQAMTADQIAASLASMIEASGNDLTEIVILMRDKYNKLISLSRLAQSAIETD